MPAVTRAEIEAKAASLAPVERLRIWVEVCRTPHVWRALPQTTTGEHFCAHCGTLFAAATGQILNFPKPR